MNVSEFLLERGRDDAVALVDGERSYTYAELRASVARLATHVEESPAVVGDRVGIIARNSFFWVASYFAILRTGRIAVPFATTSSPADVTRQAAWVGVALFAAERGQVRRFAEALAATPSFDERAVDTTPSGATSGHAVEVAPDADAVLQLTSGTTSAPRAVRVTHANIQANTGSIIDYLALGPDDRMLVVLPFSYCFGASLLHTHLRVGGSVALCHTLAFPESVVDAIEAAQCTGFAGVPSTYQLLLRASSFHSRPLRSLRHLQQAGGRLSPSLVDELVAAQPGARVFVMYGQTEATARLSFLPPEEITRRAGSVGRGLPGIPLRVVDGEDRDVAPGAVGEVIAAGPNVTKGYWNDEDATAEKYRGGVLRTGDLATVDEDGYVYIVDRASDFIKSWGFRVSSQEVEDAALQVPGVRSAAAIGVPDDIAGEAIALFVVPSAEHLTADDVLQQMRRNLAKHMVPGSVRIVAELPLNANGKPVKERLRELLVGGTNEDPG